MELALTSFIFFYPNTRLRNNKQTIYFSYIDWLTTTTTKTLHINVSLVKLKSKFNFKTKLKKKVNIFE